ncbi:MAG: ParB/RepB/Spo0J family partition protein [Holosporales bacterium]|jgi:ParB family chromosome partitioning protein|nr:ParB/RepB/Spo0J family partition protein [Holosporales bacterium]
MEQKLGRGLSALLGDGLMPEALKKSSSPRSLGIDLIESNENQPRKFFDEDSIAELAESIAKHGILQPIIVRKKDESGENYKIVAGERRWRAAKLAGFSEIPAQIVECDDAEVVTLALIENIQREDLNPIEEAEALKELMSSCGCRQEDLGTMISKSRSYVANALRLLALSSRIQELIRTGRISAGHGKCLIGLVQADRLAEDAAQYGWSVRYLEKIVQSIKRGELPGADRPGNSRMDINFDSNEANVTQEAAEISVRVAEALGVETKIQSNRRGGYIILSCKSYQQLEELIGKLLQIADLTGACVRSEV